MFKAYTLPGLRRSVITEDGQYLDTLRLGPDTQEAVVICHGFGGNKNISGLVDFAEDLARRYRIYTFDFRGHGLSPGACTFGYLEALDVKAVLQMVREDGHGSVGAVGFSMGGVALLRYASSNPGLASIITISVPADIRKSRAPGARLIRRQMGNPISRALASRRYKVKIDRRWKRSRPPMGALAGVKPLTIIHGEDDYVFEPEQALELARNCPGSRLHILPAFGHAEQGYGPELVRLVLQVLKEDFTAARGAAEPENSPPAR
jgi:pimeloyl-ACP methyl ester carboxylesterase